MGYMIGKEGQFSKEIQKDFDVYMRCERRTDLTCLRPDESVCRLSGKYQAVKESIQRVI